MNFSGLVSALSLLLLIHGGCAYQSEVNNVATSYLRAGAGANELLTNNHKVGLLHEKFHAWANDFGKTYDSIEEQVKRMLIWIDNHELIEKHNNQVPPPSYTLGHNAFSDLTLEEFKKLSNLGEFAPDTSESIEGKHEAQAKIAADSEDEELEQAVVRKLFEKKKLPKSVDWVKEGAVTEVKNQGQCGACWAFSTTGAIEGAKFIKDGKLVSLSEQNLVDCDRNDLGCNGGLMDHAFVYDESSGGLCSEEDYPYVAKQSDTCQADSCKDVPGTIVKSFVDVTQSDPDALMAAIAQQPVSIAIQADQFAFQFYKSGVLDDDSCGESGAIDHGVLVVGYGTDKESGKTFWKVKNSWGAEWGEEGYVRMSRESSNQYGMCSILRLCSFPILK